MMRKKSALHLDSRYATMIENAYFYSNPPEARQATRVKRPPMHEYIRKLLYKDLSKTTIERVLRQMRKLDWDNHEVSIVMLLYSLLDPSGRNALQQWISME